MNCLDIEGLYPEKAWETISADEWHEFYSYGGYESKHKKGAVSGVLNCFCQKQFKEMGSLLVGSEWFDSQ